MQNVPFAEPSGRTRIRLYPSASLRREVCKTQHRRNQQNKSGTATTLNAIGRLSGFQAELSMAEINKKEAIGRWTVTPISHRSGRGNRCFPSDDSYGMGERRLTGGQRCFCGVHYSGDRHGGLAKRWTEKTIDTRVAGAFPTDERDGRVGQSGQSVRRTGS